MGERVQKTDREIAHEHWGYTEKVVLKMFELCKQLYIDGMIHGIKHGREDR